MSTNKGLSKALSLLIPTGVIGISSALASNQPQAPVDTSRHDADVATRLSDIRSAVSSMEARSAEQDASGPKLMIAEWVNFGGGLGWRNGGWGNGGWHNWGNGGWGNGGWGNGGWHNWHNFWHNW